jgi:hypothetical protein
MVGEGRIRFDDLARPVVADPGRAARVDALHDEAKGEHFGVTQSAVSQALKSAATVSGIRHLVAGMGAELELVVKVGDHRYLVDA